MKKIIVLYGRGEIGKTSTLRMVSDKLEGLPLSYSKSDIRCYYQYLGKKIDVTTWGDNADEMNRNIDFMNSHPFDISVTAARSYGRTHSLIKEYACNIGAELVWVHKVFELGEYNSVNQKYANKITRIINELVEV